MPGGMGGRQGGREGEGGRREITLVTELFRAFLTFSTSFLSCEPGAKVSIGSLLIGGTRTAGEAYSLELKSRHLWQTVWF